jgi:hypothetical protein
MEIQTHIDQAILQIEASILQLEGACSGASRKVLSTLEAKIESTPEYSEERYFWEALKLIGTHYDY